MAARQFETDSFMSKFFQLLHCGESAQLMFECYNGQLYVNLRASLQENRKQQFYQPHQYHQQQQVPSPSRLRRRARRAAARDKNEKTSDTAAAQASRADTKTAEENILTPTEKVDVAVQVAENPVPVNPHPQKLVEKGVQVCDQGHYYVEQGVPLLPSPHPHSDVQELPQYDQAVAVDISAEQAVPVQTDPAVNNASADLNPMRDNLVPHPHSPYPHVTHPGRYNYCCDHRCNTGRRRTNSGKRLTDERKCCDHRCK